MSEHKHSEHGRAPAIMAGAIVFALLILGMVTLIVVGGRL